MSSKEEDSLKQLEKSHPQSTDAERRRFLAAQKGDVDAASVQLKEYLEWRATHDLDSPDNQRAIREQNDKEDWAYACSISLMTAAADAVEVRRSLKKKRHSNVRALPHFVRVYTDNETGMPVKANNGHMLLHVTPAQVDKKLGSAATYSLALALYLDRKFDRATLDQGLLLIDVRPGEGWPNQKANKLMSFIKTVANVLYRYFPERMNMCIVYPLPRTAIFLWNMAKPLLNRGISQNTTLVSGSDAINAPPPNSELSKHIGEPVLHTLEDARLAAFISQGA